MVSKGSCFAADGGGLAGRAGGPTPRVEPVRRCVSYFLCVEWKTRCNTSARDDNRSSGASLADSDDSAKHGQSLVSVHACVKQTLATTLRICGPAEDAGHATQCSKMINLHIITIRQLAWSGMAGVGDTAHYDAQSALQHTDQSQATMTTMLSVP